MHMKIISNAYIGFKGRSNVMNCHIMSRHPLLETVALVEDIVVEYVTDMVHKAQCIDRVFLVLDPQGILFPRLHSLLLFS
ncbi:putative transcription factor Hap3/NF-YB family [Helianthus annuus]|nr:putative transcription factor Hap3/NF-YB family [Helianthus annuus]